MKKLSKNIIFVIFLVLSICVSIYSARIYYHLYCYYRINDYEQKIHFINMYKNDQYVLDISKLILPIVIPILFLTFYWLLRYFGKCSIKKNCFFLVLSSILFVLLLVCVYLERYHIVHNNEIYMQTTFYKSIKLILYLFGVLSIFIYPLLVFTTKYSILYLVSKRKNSNFYRNKLETKKRKIDEKLKELQ